jgi:hypothetical protein
VEVTGDTLTQCNGTAQTLPHPSPVIVTGQTTGFGVSIWNSNLSIRLLSVAIHSPNPFLSAGSSVQISLDGANIISSANSSVSASECAQNSTLTFAGLPNGSLDAAGETAFDTTGVCASLTFLARTYTATSNSGPGIGTRFGAVKSITFENAEVVATSVNGSGIGAGDGGGVKRIGIIGGPRRGDKFLRCWDWFRSECFRPLDGEFR